MGARSGLVSPAAPAYRLGARSYAGTAAVPVAPSYADEVLADDPLIYLRLNDTVGTVAADSSGNGTDGTYVGAPTLGATAASAELGTAVTFNGTSQYLDATTLGTFGSGLEDGFTLEWWFQHTTTAQFAWTGFLNDGGNTALLVFGNTSAGGTLQTNSFRVFFRTEGGVGSDQKAFSATLNDGAWHHFALAATPAAGTMSLRVDKAEVLTGLNVMSNFADLAYPLVFAANNSRSTIEQHYPGDVDEIAVYTTALSATRTNAHYDAAGV